MHLSLVTCSTSCKIRSKQTVEDIHHQNPYKQKHYSYRHFGLMAAAETLYSKLATFAQDLLSVRHFRHRWNEWRWMKWMFSVSGLLTLGHRNRMNITLQMRMCHKPNSKMPRVSGFAYPVLNSLTHRLYCVVTFCGTVCEPVRLADSHIKQNQMVFDSVFIAQKGTQTKMIYLTKLQ